MKLYPTTKKNEVIKLLDIDNSIELCRIITFSFTNFGWKGVIKSNTKRGNDNRALQYFWEGASAKDNDLFSN